MWHCQALTLKAAVNYGYQCGELMTSEMKI